jgi:hypothetical protein
MNLLEHLNQFGPNKCRFLARSKNGNRPASERELAKRSGLSHSTIQRISRAKSWDNFTLDTIVSFTLACGIDLMKPRTSFYYKVRRSKRYIEKMSGQQRRFYATLL